MPANTVVINNHTEFIVPDSKMELVLALLVEASVQGVNIPERWEPGCSLCARHLDELRTAVPARTTTRT